MIPLRDANPTNSFPAVNYTLIAINAAAFLYELNLSGTLTEAQFAGFMLSYGVVPSKIVADVESVQFQSETIFSFFSSMFLHGGWMHLIGNMLFLHVFGDNIEDQLGKIKYVLFYLLAGICAATSQIIINPASNVPMIGASGAISGVLGAYVLLFPRAKILTLIPIFRFVQLTEIPAGYFLGFWFLMQLFSGSMALGVGGDAGGVAWWAHIGGFVAGVILLFAFKRRN